MADKRVDGVYIEGISAIEFVKLNERVKSIDEKADRIEASQLNSASQKDLTLLEARVMKEIGRIDEKYTTAIIRVDEKATSTRDNLSRVNWAVILALIGAVLSLVINPIKVL